MPAPVFTETLQIAIVVRDLDAAMRTYGHDYGIGPWETYEFNPENVEDLREDGKPADFSPVPPPPAKTHRHGRSTRPGPPERAGGLPPP
jgi:hypothetical protein